MAIKIRFDSAGNPEPPTIILTRRNSDRLGQLEVEPESIDLNDKFNDASEFSFNLHKYINGRITNLWDEVVDFKLVYCKEWDMYFQISVELDEETETIKTVMCTQLGQAELSQIMLYNIHINEEGDSNWDSDNTDYKSTILYDEYNPKTSLLHRLLKDKAPHYSIKHVDDTIKNIQRTFSFDGTSIYDAFMEIAEEIGCLFVFHSNSDENGNIQRTISVYDLQQNCMNIDCNHRGEFIDECPECGSKDIKYGYGEDTTIFVTADELAASGIQLTTDVDAVKNCFKLEAGDDLMTATIRNCNPNGTDYIWYFSDSMKAEMSEELVDKIESYDVLYKEYYNNHVFDLDASEYNNLVNKYMPLYNAGSSTCLNCDHKGDFGDVCPECGSENIYTKSKLEVVNSQIKGYSALMNTYYNVVDLGLYLESSLMPSVEIDETDAEKEGLKLTSSSLSPVAVADLKTVSLATANSAVLAMAKIIVKSTFKVDIVDNSSELSNDKKTWKGRFVITNYSDEKDTYTTNIISVIINDDLETAAKQKVEKALNKDNTDNVSITGLFEKDYDDFCAELKKYALIPLEGFYDSCQTCIDILIEQGAADKTQEDLYNNLYTPYYNKLLAIQSEITIRESEVELVKGTYNLDDELIEDGFQTEIEKLKKEVQDILNFEEYLGTDLWFEFCSHRREDKYTNDNYISDGLDNAKLFEKAMDFINVANDEIYKSAELQHSISTSLKNLLAISKFKPLVEHFENGNWLRVCIDDQIYKLRLLEYSISFGSFDEIPVEFSDVTKIKNGITDVSSILSQASSMATSYSSVQRQANQGENAKGTVDTWLTKGLNSALVRIKSNDSEEITFTKNGLLCRSYNDITETHDPEQLKLTHNIIAYTDDNWNTVRQAIGKHDYIAYSEMDKKFIDKTGYGMSADFVTAGIVSGSQIIGGAIYSDNYSENAKTGSYLDLRDGSFSFAGEKIKYDNDKLVLSEVSLQWNDIDNAQEMVTKITEDTVTSEYIKTLNLEVGNEIKMGSNATISWGQVTGTGNVANKSDIPDDAYITKITKDTVTTSYVNALNITAKDISATTLTGKTISGGSISIGADGSTPFAVRTDGHMDAASANLAGWMSTYVGSGTDKRGYLWYREPSAGSWVSGFKTSGDIFLFVNSPNSGTNSTDGVTNAGSAKAWIEHNGGCAFARYGTGNYTLRITNDSGTSAGKITMNAEASSDGAVSINGWLKVAGKIIPSSTNTGFIGDSNNRWQQISANNIYYATTCEKVSDGRLKNNINPIKDSKYMNFFDLLNPVFFEMKDKESYGSKKSLGFIAQEVEEALEQSDLTEEDFVGLGKNDEGYYALGYSEFIALNTAKIKQLEQKLEQAIDTISEQQIIINELRNKVI